jgi:hypothetical protein
MPKVELQKPTLASCDFQVRLDVNPREREEKYSLSVWFTEDGIEEFCAAVCYSNNQSDLMRWSMKNGLEACRTYRQQHLPKPVQFIHDDQVEPVQIEREVVRHQVPCKPKFEFAISRRSRYYGSDSWTLSVSDREMLDSMLSTNRVVLSLREWNGVEVVQRVYDPNQLETHTYPELFYRITISERE